MRNTYNQKWQKGLKKHKTSTKDMQKVLKTEKWQKSLKNRKMAKKS